MDALFALEVQFLVRRSGKLFKAATETANESQTAVGRRIFPVGQSYDWSRNSPKFRRDREFESLRLRQNSLENMILFGKTLNRPPDSSSGCSGWEGCRGRAEFAPQPPDWAIAVPAVLGRRRREGDNEGKLVPIGNCGLSRRKQGFETPTGRPK